jgi:hypothetical protein
MIYINIVTPNRPLRTGCGARQLTAGQLREIKMASELRDDAPACAARDADVQAEEKGREGEDAVIGRTVTINRPREEIYAFWRDFWRRRAGCSVRAALRPCGASGAGYPCSRGD